MGGALELGGHTGHELAGRSLAGGIVGGLLGLEHRELGVDRCRQTVARRGGGIAVSRGAIAARGVRQADLGGLESRTRRTGAVRRALRTTALRAISADPIRGVRGAPVAQLLVAVSQPLVAVGRELIAIRGRLIGVREGLVEIRAGLICVGRRPIVVRQLLPLLFGFGHQALRRTLAPGAGHIERSIALMAQTGGTARVPVNKGRTATSGRTANLQNARSRFLKSDGAANWANLAIDALHRSLALLSAHRTWTRQA
ncbi:MAG TPA: hypothetical protein VNT03_10770 [Baekduia sp.]|nr:hypothetical protein [Baekduia sp.]